MTKAIKRGPPAHLMRPSPEAGKGQKRKPPAAPVREYRPGYFTEPVRGKNGRTWPPGWEPHTDPLKTATEYHLDAARAVAMQRRVGFAADGGTVVMPGTPPRRGRTGNQKGY